MNAPRPNLRPALASLRPFGGSRVAIALLLVYQAVFLNVFVPSHTPARITVAGGAPVAAAASHCCAGKPDATAGGRHDDDHGDRDGEDSPAAPDRSRCAVCNLVARLAPATTVDLILPEHQLLERTPRVARHVAPAPPVRVTYLGRGPPADSPATV